jgi:hypothetical protein
VRFQSDFRGASQAAAPGGAAADLGPVDDDGRKMNFSSRDGWHASRGPASTPLMLTDRVF